jgi:hypothetical protein
VRGTGDYVQTRAMAVPRLVFALAALLWGTSCHGGGGRSSGAQPARSPSLDYPAPAQETSQGEVIGADRVPPGDKLKTSPRAGTEGVTPGVTPAATPATPEPSMGKPLPSHK